MQTAQNALPDFFGGGGILGFNILIISKLQGLCEVNLQIHNRKKQNRLKNIFFTKNIKN